MIDRNFTKIQRVINSEPIKDPNGLLDEIMTHNAGNWYNPKSTYQITENQEDRDNLEDACGDILTGYGELIKELFGFAFQTSFLESNYVYKKFTDPYSLNLYKPPLFKYLKDNVATLFTASLTGLKLDELYQNYNGHIQLIVAGFNFSNPRLQDASREANTIVSSHIIPLLKDVGLYKNPDQEQAEELDENNVFQKTLYHNDTLIFTDLETKITNSNYKLGDLNNQLEEGPPLTEADGEFNEDQKNLTSLMATLTGLEECNRKFLSYIGVFSGLLQSKKLCNEYIAKCESDSSYFEAVSNCYIAKLVSGLFGFIAPAGFKAGVSLVYLIPLIIKDIAKIITKILQTVNHAQYLEGPARIKAIKGELSDIIDLIGNIVKNVSFVNDPHLRGDESQDAEWIKPKTGILMRAWTNFALAIKDNLDTIVTGVVQRFANK